MKRVSTQRKARLEQIRAATKSHFKFIISLTSQFIRCSSENECTHVFSALKLREGVQRSFKITLEPSTRLRFYFRGCGLWHFCVLAHKREFRKTYLAAGCKGLWYFYNIVLLVGASRIKSHHLVMPSELQLFLTRGLISWRGPARFVVRRPRGCRKW